jgi:outer membrane protein OmpA-like peptidoglycan-associated protein
MILNKAIFPIMMGTLIILAGCTTTHSQNKPLSMNTYHRTLIGTTVGAATGGVVGSFVHQPLAGIIVGGGLGTIIGYSHTQEHMLKKQDVNAALINNQIILLLPSDKLFETNTADFTYQGTVMLNTVSAFLKKYPEQNIHISANTSPVNSNLKFQKQSLSLQQAEHVAGFLWAKGLRQGPTGRQLTYSGDDADYPIATNKKFAGMMTNRRVQITVYNNMIQPYPQSSPVKSAKHEW